MWWFGSEIPVLHHLPACPCSQLPPAEQGSLGSAGICMEQLNICLKLPQILHFRGWSKVGTRPGGIWSCSAPNCEVRVGENQEGSWGNLNSLHTVHVKCLKSWACVSSNQPMASTTLPPDLVQNLQLQDFIWNCSPWKQGILAAGRVRILGSTWWGNVSEGGAGAERLWIKEWILLPEPVLGPGGHQRGAPAP